MPRKPGLTIDTLRDHALALGHADPYSALEFLVAWPRRDLPARLVVSRFADRDGNQNYTLSPVAEPLEREFPMAATILYRALLDDVLLKARSKAYPHAARYLKRLGVTAVAAELNPGGQSGIARHSTYLAGLKRPCQESRFLVLRGWLIATASPTSYPSSATTRCRRFC